MSVVIPIVIVENMKLLLYFYFFFFLENLSNLNNKLTLKWNDRGEIFLLIFILKEDINFKDNND